MINRQHGFHLMEILAACALISIIAALALPLYTQHLVTARRMEAASTLSRLALAMEQYHTEHQTYTGATLTGLHISEYTSKNAYHLLIRSAASNDYTVAAEPLGNQAAKDPCKALTLNSSGEKGISGQARLDECW